MQRVAHLPRVRRADLGSHEYLGAIQAAVRKGLADLGFVVVHRRGIDMAVADLEGGDHGGAGLAVAQLPRAEAD